MYFLHQDIQANAWDHPLIHKGEKITVSHGEVEKMKLGQRRLEEELDFVLLQQKELEDLLIPFEESVENQSGSVHPKYVDEECERT